MKKRKGLRIAIAIIATIIVAAAGVVAFFLIRERVRENNYKQFRVMMNQCDAEGALECARKSGREDAVEEATQLQRFLERYEKKDWEGAIRLADQSKKSLPDSEKKRSALYSDCHYQLLIPEAERYLRDGSTYTGSTQLLEFHNCFNDGNGNRYRDGSWYCDFRTFQEFFPEESSHFFDLICTAGEQALETENDDALEVLSEFRTAYGSRPRTFDPETFSWAEAKVEYDIKKAEEERLKAMVPEDMDEIFEFLNETEEDFDRMYQICMEVMEERRTTEEWEELCHTVSGAVDDTRSRIFDLYQTYGMLLRSAGTEIYYANLVKKGIRPQLLMNIYTPGNRLDLVPLWMPSLYDLAVKDRSFGGLRDDGNGGFYPDGTHPGLWQFAQERYGVEAWRVYEEISAGRNEEEAEGKEFQLLVTERICKAAGISGEEFLEAYTSHMEAERKRIAGQDARKNGDPYRILIVDTSKTIRGEEIKPELFEDGDSKSSERVQIKDRADLVLKMFAKYGKNYELTGYPELADVVIELNTSYPYAGRYAYSDGTPANVYNTVVNITAKDLRDNKTKSVKFGNYAGNRVSVTGGTLIYMNLPDLFSDKNIKAASAFAEEVSGWYEAQEEPEPEEDGDSWKVFVGEWTGKGEPKNGGDPISLEIKVNDDATGEYTFEQDDYRESYPFTLASEDSSFEVNIPADNQLGITSCKGTYSYEDGRLVLHIKTEFSGGRSFEYTADCTKK